MANIPRMAAEIRNKLYESVGEAAKGVDIGQGYKMDYSPCSDKRYNDATRYKRITVMAPNGKDHESYIYDMKDGKWV